MKFNLFTIFCLLVLPLTLTNVAKAEATEGNEEDRQESGKMYLKSDNTMGDLDRILQQAKSTNKLAIIAMGANWCHDSQSFAKKMQHPKISQVIDQHYLVALVDVGYLTDIKQVITRFGLPIIYATPTVLVVDPVSNLQINQDNMHVWRDAANLSVEETVKYFSELAENRSQNNQKLIQRQAENLGRLASLNQQIDQFQQLEANRLYRAFSIIGPLLEQQDNGGEPKDFNKLWKQVAKYRYTITGDLAKLREQAREIAQSDDQSKTLDFPEYPEFEWEK